MGTRIYLSPPHMGGEELAFIRQAFDSNYIAPLGPQVDLFETEFADYTDTKYAAAVSSGTAALHLALRYAGVVPGDEVFCSTLTFVASANAIKYLDAKPVFIDSEPESWHMDPNLLEMELEKRKKNGRIPKALVIVHIYGSSADLDPIVMLCKKYGIFLIEDAAESLGARYKENNIGTYGNASVFSFNGNKIITTSGGGMIVSADQNLIEKAKYWATQARDPVIHYEHSELGYNYRMSNILAAIGRGQLRVLSDHIKRKQEINKVYREHLECIPGIKFMPVPWWSDSTFWLTCLTIDNKEAQFDRTSLINLLEDHNIESRPTWKPMHLQPLYRDCQVVGGKTSEVLFNNGICLPSGSSLNEDELEKIISIIINYYKKSINK